MAWPSRLLDALLAPFRRLARALARRSRRDKLGRPLGREEAAGSRHPLAYGMEGEAGWAGPEELGQAGLGDVGAPLSSPGEETAAPADVSAGEGDAAPQGAIDRPGPALSLPTAAPLPAGAGRPIGIAPVHPVRPLGPDGPRPVLGESSPAVTDEPVQGARFANIEIADEATREPLGEVPVQPGQRLTVLLDIGPLSEQNAVSS
ncbi:MAG TPA: hypothetical protein VK425_01475, partial [Acidimicrobiales bacterium]|nr:hypothetical protein [Acidimicrobiales bacterium]